MNYCFSRESGSFKGGRVMLLAEGGASLGNVLPFGIIISPPCLGGVGRFGFAPRRHGVVKICLYYEG